MINQKHSFYNQRNERGVVLLICLVLIGLVTVLSISALRSTMLNVKSTALLQEETQAYHLLNAELIAQLDALYALRQNNPGLFEANMTAIYATATQGAGGFQAQALRTPQNNTIVRNMSATIYARKVSDSFNGLGVQDPNLPQIQRTMCNRSNSGNPADCINFIVVVQGTLRRSGVTLQQISGFGLSPN